MTRYEYMEELRLRLAVLSTEERSEALQFYTEYFEEAGPENEQAVIAELGTPSELAKRIISGTGGVGTWKNAGREAAESYRTYQQNHRRQTEARRHSGMIIALICLAVIGAPIWLSLFAAALLIVLAFGFTVAMIVLAAILVIVALIAACIFCFGFGLWLMPRDLLNGIFIFSIGLMGCGGALIAVPLTGLLIRKGFPAIGRLLTMVWEGMTDWIRRTFGRLSKRR